MDIHMPVMDGLEAASKITELGSKTPIVTLTANVMTNELEHYRKSYMTDVLGKPFTAQELWSCLMKYLPVSGFTTSDSLQSDKKEEKMLEQLQSYFVRNNKTMYKLIYDALEDDNVVLAHRLAHTLKGNAEMIREMRLYKAAAAVEDGLSNEKKQVSAKQLYTLETEFSAVIDKLTPQTSRKRTKGLDIAIDKTKIKALVDKLEPMLMNFDTDCYELLDEIRQIPGMEKLYHNVEVFDYNNALLELGKIKEKAGLSK